jgi:hypothetical protein
MIVREKTTGAELNPVKDVSREALPGPLETTHQENKLLSFIFNADYRYLVVWCHAFCLLGWSYPAHMIGRRYYLPSLPKLPPYHLTIEVMLPTWSDGVMLRECSRLFRAVE